MPRKTEKDQKAHQKARAIGKRRKLSYDAAYHLILAALEKDGIAPRGLQPDAPALADLSPEERAAYDAAVAELNA